MKKSFRCIVLSLSFPLLTYGQSNYKPGYLVNLKNDTIKGYIDYKEWRNNPKSFSFNSNLNDKEPEKFSVNNAKAFAITNLEYYQRFTAHISKGNVEIARLSRVIDTSYSIGTVFLKVITSGKNISLYSLSDPLKTRFYIEDKMDNEAKELDYFLFLDNSDIQTVYTYRKQLTILALNYKPDNDKLIQQIQRADYSEWELKSIVRSINDGESILFRHEKLSGVRLFAGAGIKANKLTFIGQNGPFPDGTNRSNTFPSISAGADIVVNKNTQKLIFRAEAMVTSNHYHFTNTDATALITSTNLDFKQFNASLIPQVIYNFYSGSNLKAFFDAGIAFNFSFYNNYNYITNYFDQITLTQNKYPQFDKVWYSFPLKAGLLLNNRLEIYASYWPSSSLISNVNYSASISSYQFGINYMFEKK
jgi:hypothetical protein